MTKNVGGKAKGSNIYGVLDHRSVYTDLPAAPWSHLQLQLRGESCRWLSILAPLYKGTVAAPALVLGAFATVLLFCFSISP